MSDSQSEPTRAEPGKPAEEPPESTVPVVSSTELFGPVREIWIDHDGERYRLRITRRNKLILQK